MTASSTLLYVLADVALVVAASGVLGAAVRRAGQPAVAGQLITGLLLGASFLGRLPGHIETRLFPAQVVPYLTVLSQVAVVIFMFTVGYELDFRAFRGLARAIPAVASSALLVPMALGVILALSFAGNPVMAHSAATPAFVIFMAVAMSITALPVLAAIVRERGIVGTRASVVATTAAGIMDASAWAVLAVALALAKPAAGRPWPLTLLFVAVFAAFMLLVLRPVLAWWLARPRSVFTGQVPLALALATGSAWVTASLGLHPVFGAFLAGLAMRGRGKAPDADVFRFMEAAGSVLLPLFFVVTGLSVTIGSLGGWGISLTIILCLAASLGKLGPAYAASRLSGLDPGESATTAALVNTRGLTELIALTVGLQAGLIGPRLFTVLVLMALVTTLMTGPLLSLINRSRPALALVPGAPVPDAEPAG